MNTKIRFLLIGLFIAALLVLVGLLPGSSFSAAISPVAYAETGPLAEQVPQGQRPLRDISQVTLPPPDVAALLQEDEARDGAGLPPRFAQPIAAKITPETDGDWETLDDGTLLWRLRLGSPGALSLNLGFERYQMPADGRLYLYTPDYEQMIRPFTAADNKEHGQLWTPILQGSEIVLAVHLPGAARPELELLLTTVNYGYQEFGRAARSGACNVDVVCPEGDDWGDQIRSVGVISTGGSTFCTGFMVNNSAQDLTPYFMTARHCGITAGNAASLVVYWNYENSICRPPGSAASGGPGDGVLTQFQTGSTWRSSYTPSDFTLVEMDDAPDPDFEVYWAGWDATSADALWAVAIHHPNTDEKRISFEYDPTTTTSYLGTAVPGDGTHVRVEDWDLGTTEPGSSGSPLFNQDKRVIGQLHGGYAACGNDLADWYGRISTSWTGGGSSSTRLSDWLDPLNSGSLVLDGRNASPFALQISPVTQHVCLPDDGLFDITVSGLDGFADPVTLSLSGAPAPATVNFSPNPVIPTGNALLTLGNTAAVPSGSYALTITGTAGADSVALPAWLNLYSDLPEVVSLLSPANGAGNVPQRPTFTWTAAAEGGAYELQIATDSAFNNIVHSATDIKTTGYTPPTDLLTSTVYYWRVRAVNGCGAGSYTAAFTFTTAAAPGDCGPGYQPVIHFSDDFEGGAAGWSSDGIGNTWALSGQRPYSGLSAYKAIGSPAVSDQRLVSPPVSLPTGQAPLTLQFWNYQHLESRSGGCFDGAILELSTDDGATWSQIQSPDLLTDPYDGPISTAHSNPLGGLNAWCGDPQDWLKAIVNIDSYAGQTARFRFRVGTDSSVSREGWYIDDVVVRSCQMVEPEPEYDATLTPTSNRAALPGSVVTHTFVLENLADDDSYDLALSGYEWPSSLLTVSPLTVTSGMTATISVAVAVPDMMRDVIMGDDTFTLTVTSQGDPQLVLSSVGATNAVVQPGMSTSGDMAGVGSAGGTIIYSVGVTNTGNYTDTFMLVLGSHDWTASPQYAIIGPLAPGADGWLDIYITVGSGASDSVVVTFTSSLDSSIWQEIILTSETRLIYLPLVIQQ